MGCRSPWRIQARGFRLRFAIPFSNRSLRPKSRMGWALVWRSPARPFGSTVATSGQNPPEGHALLSGYHAPENQNASCRAERDLRWLIIGARPTVRSGAAAPEAEHTR